MIVRILCVLLAISTAVESLKTAIYFDNGYDQTEIDREMTTQEKQQMELEILQLLGLPNRPRKVRKNAQMHKSAAPRFLLDIYKKLMEEDNEDEDEGSSRRKRSTDDLNLSGEEQQQIDQSDLIITFESINHHVSSVRHERGKRLWFNVSKVPLAEDIVGAELRIYQSDNYTIKNPNRVFTVSIYELVNTDDGERELEFVSAVNTTANYSGWLELNLTASLATWVAFPDSNKGLYLSVHSIDRPGHEIRPEDIGLVTSKVQNADDEGNFPFMVAFLKANNHVKPTRSIRSATTIGRTRVKKSEFHHLSKSSKNGEDSWRTCKIHTLYISFKDLKWQDWIIAPEGYGAYYCAGECNFPLNAHMNATNHAIVQTLVSLIYPLRCPKPCCEIGRAHV